MSTNLWADGWLNLDCQSLRWPKNPVGAAFLCRDCWQQRSQQTGQAMPNRKPERWPPAPQAADDRRALPPRTHSSSDLMLPDETAQPGFFESRLHSVLNALGIIPAEPETPPDPKEIELRSGAVPGVALSADMKAMIAFKLIEEKHLAIEDALLQTLSSTTALARDEAELARTCGCGIPDTRRALQQLEREGMVYRVGINGWCYGQRQRGGGRFTR